MKIIYKYTVEVGSNSIEMPKGARILHVVAQGEKVQLWALVETEHIDEMRHFRVFGTGQPLPDDFKEDQPRAAEYGDRYIGTAHCGPFVWHVFERSA